MAVFINYLGLIFPLVLFIIALLIAKYYFENRRFFQLGSRLPGPKPLPLIGNALDFLESDFDVLSKLNELNRNFDLAATWLCHRLYIFISAPEYAEIFYKSPHLIDKNDQYKFLKPLFGNGLTVANGTMWKKSRKVVESSFSYSALKGYNDMIVEKADIMLRCLEKEEGKQSFSSFPYFRNCMFDVIFDATMYRNLNAQEEEVEVLEQADAIMTSIGERFLTIWQQFDFLYKFSKKGKDFDRRIKYMKTFAKSTLNGCKSWYLNQKETSEGSNEVIYNNNGLVGKLIETEEWDSDGVNEQLLTIILSGYETAATTISFILTMLGIHKEVQEKLYHELSACFKKDAKDFHRSEYLDMVIKETLRLYTTVPFMARKADEDIQMGKYLIPKGASVVMNLLSMHRDPNEYENPDLFNPDNFLPENIAKRHPYSFLPFAYGIRNCVAYKFAMMSIRILVSKVILKYKVECDLKLEDIKVNYQITQKMQDGRYPLRIVKRLS